MSNGTADVKVKVIGGIVVGIVALVILLAINPFIRINAGERGVVLEWGAVSDNILGEGIHWVTPIYQSVKEIDVTIRKVEKETSASSKDLQIVTTKVALNYFLDPLYVNRIYQTLRYEWELRVISPTIDEYVKKTTAKYTAEELITKRENVKADLSACLKEGLVSHHIIVKEIFMTDFAFSQEFNAAIEQKVTAEQNALREKNRLEQKKFEAEQVVVAAKAEAEKIRIQAQAITQQGGREYVNLKAVEKWDGSLPQYMIPGGALPFVNLQYTKN